MVRGIDTSWKRPVLALVTDRRRAKGGNLAAAVDAAVRGGVSVVVLREKDLPAGELLCLACQLREVTRDRAALVVNDRVDVALAAGADGVHLGENALPVRAARAVAGTRTPFLVGRSVHSHEGAVRAAAEGADYLLLGTIFPSASHPGEPAAGVSLIRQVAPQVSLPVLAIGGVTASNARECVAAGAAGVAVISALLEAPDVEAAARLLIRGRKVEITLNGEPRCWTC
jgi:thiamine-phosphate pyrophosphorylase